MRIYGVQKNHIGAHRGFIGVYRISRCEDFCVWSSDIGP